MLLTPPFPIIATAKKLLKKNAWGNPRDELRVQDLLPITSYVNVLIHIHASSPYLSPCFAPDLVSVILKFIIRKQRESCTSQLLHTAVLAIASVGNLRLSR